MSASEVQESPELIRAKGNLSGLQVKELGIVNAAGQGIPAANITEAQLWRAKYGILLANVTDITVVNNTIVLLDAASRISHYNDIPFDAVVQQVLAIVRDDKAHGKVRRKK